ncbi:hypothetical protein KKG31_02310 [Patescibacteria group bacterium]|nr:hypothetical protein [Patescibacteria group bacterium]MBU1758003.1 hypothetical protein [Patescibacteria group bacterium]
MGTYSIIKAETLTLEVTPGYIAIDSSGSVNIGAISYSPVPAEINQTFPLNSFRMIDKR